MIIISKIIQIINRFFDKKVKKKLLFCDSTAEISHKSLIVGYDRLKMMEYSLIQPGAKIILTGGNLIIGRWTSISYNVTIISGNHIPTVGIPQHMGDRIHLNDKEKDIIIGDDCWVCANSTLLCGTRLGRGCVVAACAVVNKEIPPYAVVAGVPAKIVAVKFSKDQILRHEKMLYNKNERLSENELEKLFSDYYQGLKTIGSDELSPENYKKFKTQYNL